MRLNLFFINLLIHISRKILEGKRNIGVQKYRLKNLVTEPTNITFNC